MIIIFHCISIIIFQLLRHRKRIKFLQKLQQNLKNVQINAVIDLDVENDIKFEPPVYRQRYGKVFEILLDGRWRSKVKKVVDFGCAEFGLFVFIKRLTCLNHIFFVDIDENTLEDNMQKIHPLTIEYLKRREEPLHVNVFAGSVADPDYRLLQTDAVIAIELIEHLYPDVLDAFPYNIFNYIEPKIVIVTTPNSDFNVLFSLNLRRFRHPDHKFEWSREQFQEWATNITTRFPDYTVSFYGIGKGPSGTEHLGECSQMAVFIRKDLLEDKYISKIYSAPCHCDSNSPCKGLTSQSKLLCSCTCTFCCPSASYGVCTYYSHSKQIISYEIENTKEQNPSYNIHYKFLKKIEYPFEYDNRTEEEKMIDEFRYRINTFGHGNSRFYVEDRNRSEIPLSDLIYGPDGAYITVPELSTLLTKYGYKIEECRIQETDQLETCVLYEPEMEEITSTSEASDWDEPYNKKESSRTHETYESSKDITSLEVSHDNQSDVTADSVEKKLQDPLFDSGYQKSLSLIDSPQTPVDLEESDLFEETSSTPSLSSEDNKVHLKKAPNLEKQIIVPASSDLNKFRLDINRINELDKFHNLPSGRTFLNHLLKPQPDISRKIFLKDKESLPGPSNVLPKKKKKQQKKGSISPDSEDDSSLDDVKSIANCILENTLNKLEINEENNGKDDVIEFNVQPDIEPLVYDVPLEPLLAVENGDLANNNRDIEGNNYLAMENAEENLGNDIDNDNLEVVEEIPGIQFENANFDNNNQHLEVLQVIEDPPVIFEEVENVENAENVQQVARASREALFDPNSEQDLLEDFEFSPPLEESSIVDRMNLGNHIVLIGVQPIANSADNGFPNWLLQILGAPVGAEDVPIPMPLEEPHYYCQGDGIGVHPSVIAVEVDEDEDDTDSSNNTVDFAEVDPGLSSQDMSSLPEDSQANISEMQELLDDTDDGEILLPTVTEPATEQLDSVSSSDTGIGSSKST